MKTNWKKEAGGGSDKRDDLGIVIEILRILHSVSSSSLKAVPAAFRPRGLEAQLDQVERLLESLGARS